MGLENCQIYFDDGVGSYFPGQTISGWVEFNFNSPKKIRGIQITIKGEARVHWTERESYTDSKGKSATRTVSYNGHEEYFNTKYFVRGGANYDSIELPYGKHVFKFSMILQNILPSSFEGEYGYIRYTVKATLVRPWKFDQSIKAAFTVISPLDCNSDPRARQPALLTMEKYLCCLCCREGPITGILKLPYTGYVSGQMIPYTLEIDNVSKTNISDISLKFEKIVSYHATTKTKKCTVTIATFRIDSGVSAQNSKTFTNSFTVPSLPPSNLQYCKVIDLQYELKITVRIEGAHKNMYGNIPVLIGTIPLTNIAPSTSFAQGGMNPVVNSESSQHLLGWGPSPSAPTAPVDPYSLRKPPPSYEECQFGTKSILDGTDSQYTRVNNGNMYAPVYPVYNFNAMPQSSIIPNAPME